MQLRSWVNSFPLTNHIPVDLWLHLLWSSKTKVRPNADRLFREQSFVGLAPGVQARGGSIIQTAVAPRARNRRFVSLRNPTAPMRRVVRVSQRGGSTWHDGLRGWGLDDGRRGVRSFKDHRVHVWRPHRFQMRARSHKVSYPFVTEKY
jgi:hypothetical protein